MEDSRPKGHCKHGEFVLEDGCPDCIAEGQASDDAAAMAEANNEPIPPPVSIVKVRFLNDQYEPTGREYSYFTAEPLYLDEFVQVPIKEDRVAKAVVTAVDVPESEVAAFRDKVKTIPSGSKRPAPQVETTQVELPAAENPPVAQVASLFDPPQEAPTEGEHVEQLWDEQRAAETGWPPALVTIEHKFGPPTSQELFKLYQEAAGLLRYARERVIATNDDLKPATDDLAIILTCRKAMEGRKKELVGPIRSELDKFNQAFNEIMSPVLEADRITRQKVSAFESEQRKKAAAAARIEDEKFRLAQEEAALKNGEYTVDLGTAEAPPPVPDNVRTGLGTLGGRDNWKARVVDFALLPDEYKLPNEQLLNSFARTNKGQRAIPGVEFYNDRVVTVRTKSE